VTTPGDEPGPRYEQYAQASGGSSVFQARGDIIMAQVPAPPAAMRTLPLDVADFTGRQAELAQLLTQPGTAGVVAIHAVDGMAGVGKTALVRRAAHLLAGRFPDGQLFVDLHAHTPGQVPADPAAVLAWLLDKTGLDPRHLPADLDGRAARWRDRIAGRRVLLVLDDAATSAQVRPLLPGSPDCLVLITSRRRLVDLEGAVPLPLTILPPDQARLLFLRVCRRAPVPGQGGAVIQIARLCGYLPLAITLLARRLIHRDTWSIADLAAHFAAATDRLAELSGGDRPGDVAVATAFEMSYHDLPPGQRKLFRRLGLHPGPDIDTYAAAALDDIPLARARLTLDALYLDHLLDETAPGRYRLHDLLRSYARALASHDRAAGRTAALDRLLDYYQHTAQRAGALVARTPRLAPTGPPPPQTQDFPDAKGAWRWLRTERSGLDACFEHAAANDRDEHTTGLAAGLAELLLADGPWTRAVNVHTTAIAAAERLGDRDGQAIALTNLGVMRQLTGDYPGAADALTSAFTIYSELGNRLGQAAALTDLGIVRQLTGDYPGAADTLTSAFTIYSELGNRLGQATALNELGQVRYMTGDYSVAVEALTRAFDTYRELGNRHGQATALTYMGSVRQLTGDHPGAADALTSAFAIYSELGNRLGQANALNQLGDVRYSMGDYPGAADVLTRSLDTYRELGNRHGQAAALTLLGQVRYSTGDYPGAADALTRALDTYRELGSRNGQAGALTRLGTVRQLTGDHPGAADALTRALDIYRQLGNRSNEAWARNHYAAAIAAAGDPVQALAHYTDALALNRELKKLDDEAISLEGIGACLLAAGDLPGAAAHLTRALEIYQNLGMDRDTNRVHERLTGLNAI
jgi:tetratricopeptide (TPR) repeat protein